MAISNLKIPTTILALLCMASSIAKPDDRNPADDPQRMHLAAAQLVRSQLDSGFFPYGFDFVTGNEGNMADMSDGNLVRQSGAAFVLGEYSAQYSFFESRAVLQRFLQTVQAQSITVGKGAGQRFLEDTGLYNRWQLWNLLPGPLDSLGLLYSQEGNGALVSVAGDYERTPPGATALSLLAALFYVQASGDAQFTPIMQRWKRGLMVLLVPGRGFRASLQKLEESGYVNGEAWLALAVYNDVYPDDEEVKRLLIHLDTYMIERYGEQANAQFYHWGMMAADARLRTTGEPRFVHFASRLTQMYLDSLDPARDQQYTNCATMEGLATYVALLREHGLNTDPSMPGAVQLLENSLAYNRQLQLDNNSAATLPINPAYLSQLREFSGAFVMSQKNPVMRVDITQHCLSALMRSRRAGLGL